MLKTELLKLNLPAAWLPTTTRDNWPQRREEIVQAFAHNVYGASPAAPAEVRAEVIREEEAAWAGKADHLHVALAFDTPAGAFSFPVDILIPTGAKPKPFFVYISFTRYPSAGSAPIEEILDAGYGLAVLCYTDVTSDDADMQSGMMPMFPRTGRDAWGKIGAWAYAASRVMDYLMTQPRVDASRVYVAGHSRLGKTAMWCAAQDTRFAGVLSNESGCSGAAISRGKEGETIGRITTVFPYWFCERYRDYADREYEAPVDQHELIAAMAPRLAYVTSAIGDEWSGPRHEFLSCVAASETYERLGMRGFVREDRFVQPGECLMEGEIGYHLRAGTHFFSREDWGLAMRFFTAHAGEPQRIR